MAGVHDRRVARTQRALSEALFDLIQVKRYDRITVQDIIDRADVGRSTFYAHYQTKDELLLSSIDRLTEDLDRFFDERTVLEGPLLPARGLFHHVAGQRRVFTALFGTRGIELMMSAATDLLSRRAADVARALDAAGIAHGVDPEVRGVYYAGAFMAFVRWWLDHGADMTPDEAADVFERLTASA